ncbi:MAG: hypothetical protein ACQEW8_08285 [Actinomycetota bacterium]
MDSVTAQGTGTGTGAAGLATRGARWALVFVWSCGLAQAVIDGRFTDQLALPLLAFAVALWGAIVLTWRQDRPLTGARAVAVPVAALIVTALALAISRSAEPVWLLDFAAYLLALQLARGNPVMGLGGGAAQVLTVSAWGAASGHAPEDIAAMLTIPLMAYVVGIIWRYVLRAIVRSERRHRSDAAESMRAENAARSAAEVVRRELDEVRRRVTPTLRLLRDGGELDDDVHVSVIVLEGSIRDRIRSPRLHHPLVDGAVTDARRRGITVTLLADEQSPSAARIGEQAAHALARLIADSTDREIVVSSTARRPDLIHVVLSTPEQHRRITLEDDGDGTQMAGSTAGGLPNPPG